MKATPLLAVLAFAAVPLASLAQDETAAHRKLYGEINAAEASFKKVTASYKNDDASWSLTGFLDDGKVRKIVAVNGDAADEFYLENESPRFVFRVFHPEREDGGRGPKIEERLYFKDGEVFKWLTTEKPAPVFHGEDYQATTGLLTGNCKAFVAALKKGKAEGAADPEWVEGVFTGIEQGDYAHWNMKTKDGKERSFFILKAEAAMEKVLDHPDQYAGKPCRVKWKKSTEDIPEAGGRREIEQVLSVEWLGKP